MKKINTENPLTLVVKAFKSTKHEMWVSLQILFCLTAMLSIVFFYYEHQAQPDTFSRFWQSLVWTLTRYLDNADAIVDKAPVTAIGKVVAMLLGIISIALVAVPAGLIGSGFMDAIAQEKREKEIEEYKRRLLKSFKRKQCRYTKYRTVPHYVSVVDIQAKQSIDTKDIIESVESCDNMRLRNLATTQPLGDHAHDRLVVEHFPKNTAYGCKIDRGSNVTIVSTSSVQEAGIGNFAYYLALYGGFNYVSKEIEVDADEPFSYYNIASEDGDENVGAFLNDIKAMERSDKNWIIFLLSASGAEEPEYPTQMHWLHGAKRGDASYEDPNITVRDCERYHAMYVDASAMMQEKYQLQSDQQQYHTASSKMYIGRHVQNSDKEVNAFTLRMAFSVSVWNDKRISIAHDLASVMRQHFCSSTIEENAAWKEKGIGYDCLTNKEEA